MTWNLTPLQANDSTFVTMVQVTNNAVDGLLITGLILAVFIIQTVYIISRRVDFLKAAALSSWSCFLYSTFFLLAGFLSMETPITFLIGAAFITLAMYTLKD